MKETNKKFYRVRLSPSCKVDSKIINGIHITKKWETKTGDAKDLALFPDVETEEMVKRNGALVPVGSISCSLNDMDPVNMTVTELKTFLSSRGVGNGKLAKLNKAELLEYAMRIDDDKE